MNRYDLTSEYLTSIFPAHAETITDLLDTLLLMVLDGDLARWPNLEASTRYQFEQLGVEFPEDDNDDA